MISPIPNTPSHSIPLTSPPLQKIIKIAASMPFNYCMGYFSRSCFNKLGFISFLSPENMGALTAFSVPVRPLTTYCITQTLRCREDTPWRNMAAIAATSITAVAISAIACNFLRNAVFNYVDPSICIPLNATTCNSWAASTYKLFGDEINTKTLVDMHAINLGVATFIGTLHKIIQKFDQQLNTEESQPSAEAKDASTST